MRASVVRPGTGKADAALAAADKSPQQVQTLCVARAERTIPRNLSVCLLPHLGSDQRFNSTLDGTAATLQHVQPFVDGIADHEVDARWQPVATDAHNAPAAIAP